MRYREVIGRENEDEWLLLEVTLGTREAVIDTELSRLKSFVSGFDDSHKARFESITGLSSAGDDLTNKTQTSLQSLMMKKFIDRISLPVLQESLGGVKISTEDIYLRLLDNLLNRGLYPKTVYVYSVYTKRGAPRSWLSVGDDFTEAEIEQVMNEQIVKIARSLTHQMKSARRLVMAEKVNGLLIYLLEKNVGAGAIQTENGNTGVERTSYTIVVADLMQRKVGVISGAAREIGLARRYLTAKTFKESLASMRKDVTIKNESEFLRKLIYPEVDDGLILQAVEFKKTSGDDEPALKLKVDGVKSLERSLKTFEKHWSKLSILDLKQADFILPKGDSSYAKVGLYTYSVDDWDRLTMNTTRSNATSEVETVFLNKTEGRIGANVKDSRFILENYTTEYVVNKLFKYRTIPTTPPIPAEAEKVVVALNKKKLIVKQPSSVVRKCWHAGCFTKSWDQERCPVCGRDEMRIVGEQVKILPDEQKIMRAIIANQADFSSNLSFKYYPHKQRNGKRKSVLGVHNADKNMTTFVLIATKPADIEYIQELSEEGFGVVALVDPKMSPMAIDLRAVGSTTMELTDLILYLLGEIDNAKLTTAVEEQERSMLKRIQENRDVAINRISKKVGYNPGFFEVDIKSLFHALVPDVIRLGTEYSGVSVPDGYLRYGIKGNRKKGSARRVFGWDAKYSEAGAYSLGPADTIKQKKYIRWLSKSGSEPASFGKLGVHAIIANFSNTKDMDKTLTNLAFYAKRRPGLRIAIVEDMLLVKIAQWQQDNWRTAIEHNNEIADEIFKWFKRTQKAQSYTISREADWKWLEPHLNKLI